MTTRALCRLVCRLLHLRSYPLLGCFACAALTTRATQPEPCHASPLPALTYAWSPASKARSRPRGRPGRHRRSLTVLFCQKLEPDAKGAYRMDTYQFWLALPPPRPARPANPENGLNASKTSEGRRATFPVRPGYPAGLQYGCSIYRASQSGLTGRCTIGCPRRKGSERLSTNFWHLSPPEQDRMILRASAVIRLSFKRAALTSSKELPFMPLPRSDTPPGGNRPSTDVPESGYGRNTDGSLRIRRSLVRVLPSAPKKTVSLQNKRC